METLIGILLSIIGGLGFMYFRKSKQNRSLKANQSLTDQKEDSTIVDEKVESAQKEIDKLESEKDKPVGDDFWDDYTKGK